MPTALITGATRGIGRGIALALAAAGWDLALNYQGNLAAAEHSLGLCLQEGAKHGHSIRATVVKADISLGPDRESLLRAVEQFSPALDLLVNNAGVAPEQRTDLLEATEQSFDRLININLKGAFFLTQLVARKMVEQARQNGPPGKIIFITSISAYTASVQRGDYCISKAGLSMASKLFSARLAGDGIGVYEIRPGIIETDMTEKVREKYSGLIQEGLTPTRRWGTPADVGQAVRAIAEDRFPFSTGQVFNVDGGFHLRTL